MFFVSKLQSRVPAAPVVLGVVDMSEPGSQQWLLEALFAGCAAAAARIAAAILDGVVAQEART